MLVSIIHQSDWETLAAWRATSRAFFTVVAALHRRRYNDHVAPFVSDIILFNDVIRTHSAIIGGSTALHFFLPDASWAPRTLDIYVPVQKYSSFLSSVADPTGLNWTMSVPIRQLTWAMSDTANAPIRPHFEHSPPTSTDPDSIFAQRQDIGPDCDGEEGESDLKLLARHNQTTPSIVPGSGTRRVRAFRTPNNRRVHVICSLSNNPITPLRFYFSSLLMNFLTPDGCVCGFPTATLDRVGVLKGTRLSECEQAEFKKYRRRGFRFDTTPLRQALDMWDFVFFGERDVLFTDFRFNVSEPQPTLPIRRTVRGWVPNPRYSMTPR